MANEHYAKFIEEAFVKPIRSVLIVDDDYPTIDEMLNSATVQSDDREIKNHKKKWRDSPQRIKNVIGRFRQPAQPLLVDIHDGTNVETKDDAKIASHLHQSDLLVLDYELDKSRPGDGSRAIKILRGLISNPHFNLVVVHTSENLEVVFRQILIGLLSPVRSNLNDEDRGRAEDLIFEREQFDASFTTDIRGALAETQYLHWRRYPRDFAGILTKKQQPYAAFSGLADAANWADSDRRLVSDYMLDEVERRLKPSMNTSRATEVQWSSTGVRWIKTESDFIAFSNKGPDDDLLGELQKALVAWSPPPSRLFLAKLRSEMDEYGVMAEAGALERKHAQAHWYAELLRAGSFERRWRIAESVKRHSDQLLQSILPRVEKFATELVSAETAAGDVNTRCLEHFGVDLNKPSDLQLANLEHNAFVCSKPPQGWHLTTGHVLDVSGENWICLSPACDLVPGQGGKRFEVFGERRPFVAVKLYEVTGERAKTIKIQSNLFVFLTIDGVTKIYSFNSDFREGTAPVWQTFYAEKHGAFHRDFECKISIPRSGKGRLVHDPIKAKVVAQLHYEYALNLLQKFGASMTRIGLDFVSGA